MALGESALSVSDAAIRSLVDRFAARLRPLHLNAQVIHGDLSGNVLFADPLPPAIIDFSPYWAPVGFALAVVVVDGIAWQGADSSIVGSLAGVAELDQLIARAAIYRLVTADRFAGERGLAYTEAHVTAHEPLLDLVESLQCS